MKEDEIDYNILRTERTIRTNVYHIKKLPEGVYACPNCYGSGRIVIVYRDPEPNLHEKCGMCHGTGEIIKCKHDNCMKPVPNVSNWFPEGLCFDHEIEYLNELIKKDQEK